ncbi:FlgD immunoglobulin-like domain containing protein [Candidatus Eisenbacteria bacterium]|uniref:FlgD immunoglobulin-like domain containing protein n=1 Tax=Eiseniibacteriota bacterium TaxID=2212470 RepID=A0ABV6YLP4_UNCEI
MKLFSLFIPVFLILALSPIGVSATPYWGPAEIAARDTPSQSSECVVSMDLHTLMQDEAAMLDRSDYLVVLGRIAQFLSIWQVDDIHDPEFGGIREGEQLPNIIETDNTSESIWVWSRYYELTGDNQYHQNVLDALTYSMNHPAYLEEGGSYPTTGYYRMYNCGWATRAELKYRQIYGDNSYQAYGDSCASYIRHNTLDLGGGYVYNRINPPVLSWALGNLYFVGVQTGNSEWRQEAVTQAEHKVKAWVEDNPSILYTEEWAMSGGATMWGLIESYFAEYPDSAMTWVSMYKDSMDVYSSPGDFRNAWNGWYALGHHAAGAILNNPQSLGIYATLRDTLISEDGDEDGGIPARHRDGDDADQTWVANYLAFMGLNPSLTMESTTPDTPFASWTTELSLASWPNPARSGLRLTYTLQQDQDASIGIFDCSGRRVASLRAGFHLQGDHALTWRGRDDAGRPVASGAYWAVLNTSRGQLSREVLWTR